jgi:hypothetical protein
MMLTRKPRRVVLLNYTGLGGGKAGWSLSPWAHQGVPGQGLPRPHCAHSGGATKAADYYGDLCCCAAALHGLKWSTSIGPSTRPRALVPTWDRVCSSPSRARRGAAAAYGTRSLVAKQKRRRSKLEWQDANVIEGRGIRIRVQCRCEAVAATRVTWFQKR